MPSSYVVTSYCWQVIDHWQALIAGALAIVAGILTVVGTVCASRMQIRAAEKLTRQEIEATNAATKLQVDAAREQTAAVAAQNEELKRAERRRRAAEGLSVAGMLDASLEVIEGQIENASDRLKSIPDRHNLVNQQAHDVRRLIHKPGFESLWERAGILGTLCSTAFVRIDAEIDNLRSDESAMLVSGVKAQLASLDAMVKELRSTITNEMARANTAIAATER